MALFIGKTMIGEKEKDFIKTVTTAVLNNPEHHDQSHWHCGTSHCWFGFAEIIGKGMDLDCPMDSHCDIAYVKQKCGFSDSVATVWSAESNTIQDLVDLTFAATDPLSDVLAQDLPFWQKTAIAQRTDLTPELIQSLAGDDDCDVRRAIAQRTDLTPVLIQALAGDDHWSVRIAIAKRTDLTSELIQSLAGDDDWSVQRAIAQRTDITNHGDI